MILRTTCFFHSAPISSFWSFSDEFLEDQFPHFWHVIQHSDLNKTKKACQRKSLILLCSLVEDNKPIVFCPSATNTNMVIRMINWAQSSSRLLGAQVPCSKEYLGALSAWKLIWKIFMERWDTSLAYWVGSFFGAIQLPPTALLFAAVFSILVQQGKYRWKDVKCT